MTVAPKPMSQRTRASLWLLPPSVAIFFAALIVPIWRRTDLASIYTSAQSLGLTTVAKGITGATFLVALVLVGLLGATLTLWEQKRGRALLCVGFAAVIAALSVILTVHDVAARRSNAVNGWVVCETGVDHFGHAFSSRNGESSFSGPHTEDGQACIHEDEHRERRPYDGGTLVDGLQQIALRFPADRPLAFRGAGLSLLAILGSAVWVMVFHRRSRS